MPGAVLPRPPNQLFVKDAPVQGRMMEQVGLLAAATEVRGYPLSQIPFIMLKTLPSVLYYEEGRPG